MTGGRVVAENLDRVAGATERITHPADPQGKNMNWDVYWMLDQSAVPIMHSMLAGKMAAGKPKTPPPATGPQPVIAIVPIFGPTTRYGWAGTTSSDEIRLSVRKAAENPAVAGILLWIDSPGGTVDGQYELAQAIGAAASKKPTHAFIDGMGTSAAYWSASQTHRITASRLSLTGSIGTVMVLVDSSEFFASMGLRVCLVSSTALKGGGVPGTVIDSSHLAERKRTVDGMQAVFTDAVAKGRRLPIEHANKLADARVHLGDEAKALRLVDQVGGWEDALDALQRDIGSTRMKLATESLHRAQAAAAAELEKMRRY